MKNKNKMSLATDITKGKIADYALREAEINKVTTAVLAELLKEISNQLIFAETLEHAPEFDGHTSEDVLERLKLL